MDNFLRDIRRERPQENKTPSRDDWRDRPVWPIVKDGTRDDFKKREPLESNPDNYVIEIFQEPSHGKPNEINVRENISQGKTVKGIIDLRQNNEGKYTIWLGEDHMVLYIKAARLPHNSEIRQYIIAIAVRKEQGNKNVRVMRDLRGQSCERTPEQIEKILDAVDVVLEKSFS